MIRALDFLKDAKVDDKGIKDMTAQSIADIIKRRRCICGHELVEGSHEYETVLKELDFLPPQSIGTTIRNFKDKITMFNAANRILFYELEIML